MDMFGEQGLTITMMIILTTEATKQFGLTKTGSILFSFIIAIGLLQLFNLKTIQTEIGRAHV